MKTHRIAAGALAAALMPELGGRIVSLRYDDGAGPALDVLVPLEGEPALPPRWPKAGAYPLAPYSNRIRDARLAAGGTVHVLPPHPDAAPHTVHGHSHRMPWRVAALEPDAATLVFEHDGSGEWPFRFAVEKRIALSGARLTVAFRFENRDTRAAPAGLGWHPYFPIAGDPAVRFAATTLWRQSPDNVATGETEPAQTPVAIGPAGDTLYFGGWDGRCEFANGLGLALTLKAEGLAHLVLHRPAGIDYLCVEPVSHVADGFNLAARGIADTGTRELAPGESFAATATLDVARG